MITSTPSIGTRQILEVTFTVERFRFDDTIIGEASIVDTSEPITIKAESEQTDPLYPGVPYRLYGKWKNHPKYGRQFHVDNWIRSKPQTRDAIVNYLLRQAEIGKKTASILFDIYGADCLARLREDPAKASAEVLEINKATRFSVKRAEKAAELLEQDEATESVAVELIDLLAGRGFPKNLHRKIVGKYGAEAFDKIKRNPYLLRHFDRVGFKSADNLYCELGLPKNKLKRQALCLEYTIDSNRDGHTWIGQSDLMQQLRKIVGAAVDFEKAVALAKRAKLIDERRECMNCEGTGKTSILSNVDGAIERQTVDCFMCQGSGGTRLFSTWSRSQNEWAIAQVVAYLNSKPSKWHEWIDFDELDGLTEHQKEQLLISLKARVCAFGGIPGTGKTYTMAQLIKALLKGSKKGDVVFVLPEDDISASSPTGKASVRMTENLENYGIGIKARTIHSLLGVVNVDGGIGFDHGPDNPFEETVFVVDERSMVDTDLDAHFFLALPAHAHVLLIGDINQLAPVGHGAPQRDLIRSGLVPFGELEEIKRQKEPGKIVEACDLIRRGRNFDTVPNVTIGTTDNLGLLFSPHPRESMQLTVDLLKSLAKGNTGGEGELDPIWDCQVIVATNDKGELSRKAVNKLLQGELNPLGQGDKNTPFRYGDKIICLKNGFVPDADGGDDVFVANGEIGRVTEAASGYTLVSLANPTRAIKIPRAQKGGADGDDNRNRDDGGTTDTGCAFDLAYGVTCHKLQGSQAKVVIVLLDETAKGLCTREWIYTAISRAESACWLVGKLETAHGMVRRVSLNRRKTFLAERLVEAGKRLVKDTVNWEV